MGSADADVVQLAGVGVRASFLGRGGCVVGGSRGVDDSDLEVVGRTLRPMAGYPDAGRRRARKRLA